MLEDFIAKANYFGTKGIPFLFLIDFEMEKPYICKLNEAKNEGVLFKVRKKSNYTAHSIREFSMIKWDIYPIPFSKYIKAFKIVISEIKKGNTYLLNLTFPSLVKTNLSLLNIFNISNAPYKLYFKNKFALFSPECFVKTSFNYIYTYPMKGTIDASKNAKQAILSDPKEEREHNTVVDLLRNDLAIVSKEIEVTKFRFVSEISTNKGKILQVSSEIRGLLPRDWRSRIGNILIKLLPAGSISGAPKKKTVEIIKKVEKIKRGYYTGIFGIFDGKEIESAVNIRYIEKKDGKMFFRSGGGITYLSNPIKEYEEMIKKVYLPK